MTLYHTSHFILSCRGVVWNVRMLQFHVLENCESVVNFESRKYYGCEKKISIGTPFNVMCKWWLSYSKLLCHNIHIPCVEFV
jgi:hypothetical protein